MIDRGSMTSLASRRRALGLTQRQVSRHAGLTVYRLSRAELGVVQLELDELERVEQVFLKREVEAP